MKENCAKCFEKQRILNDKLEWQISKAKEYVKKAQKTVVIYPTENGFRFAEEDTYTGIITMRISPDDINSSAEQI